MYEIFFSCYAGGSLSLLPSMILLEARPLKYLHMVEVSNQEMDPQHHILTVQAVELEFTHDTWILLHSCC